MSSCMESLLLEANLQPQGHTANLVVFVQNLFNGILLEGAFG